MKYVTFEMAKYLKEVGYNEPCKCYYRVLIGGKDVVFYESRSGPTKYNSLQNKISVYYAAPLTKDAFDWLHTNGKIKFTPFLHPEIKEGEVFLLNVKANENFSIPNFCSSIRYGSVAYTTDGENVVEGMKPLFGILKK